MDVQKFKKTIWSYYRAHGRKLPWRHISDPYKILVSETMLQQTQVARVLKKYAEFITKFPTVTSLAKSPLKEVLIAWQGLGYNRRAVNLKKTAEEITNNFKGKFPQERDVLLRLPGIGQSTAGALLSFTWNIPTTFIETNIRSAFIHFFFPRSHKVDDKKLLPLIEQTVPKIFTLPEKGPRDWYYALMDYGVMLKQSENPSRKSTHHLKQSSFKGSHREKRSFILKHLLRTGPQTYEEIVKALSLKKQDVKLVLNTYVVEGVLTKKQDIYMIV